MPESEKPEELHVNQLKECKILKLFTFNNAGKKNKPNKINQESLLFTPSRGLKQRSALLFLWFLPFLKTEKPLIHT